MTILVQDFHKHYDKTIAVSGIAFAVEPGEILGLVGPNGAGKTTTIRALAGIIRPTRGKLFIGGHDIQADPVRAKSVLAYVPDEPKLFDQLTVWEHFRFIASVYRLSDWAPAAELLMQQFDLTEKRVALASELSRGMRQKVAICCGYLHQPEVVLLDEPLTGLDPYGIRTMKESIRQHAARGAAFMISSHLLSLIEDICSSVLILKSGQQLLHGKLAELRRQLDNAGQGGTLEDLFFRLVGPPEQALAVEAPRPEGG